MGKSNPHGMYLGKSTSKIQTNKISHLSEVENKFCNQFQWGKKKEKQTQNINRLFIQQILIEHLLCIRKHKVLERKQRRTRHCPCLLGLKIYLKYEMSITK